MIGIIGAMTEEVELLKEGINVCDVVVLCGMEFYCGVVNDIEVVITKCGVGKVNASMAATIMIDHFECDLIINTGIAGGINGVETMRQYTEGVIVDETCTGSAGDLVHEVLLTGWKVIDGVEAWEIKNSWSDMWGNDGYIYIQSKDQEHNCGVTTDAKIPIIKVI